MKKIILFCAFFLAWAGPVHSKETLQEKQIAGCEAIGYSEWRDDCFESLGRNVLNYSLCLKITNKFRRDTCVAQYPPNADKDCLANKDSGAQDSCLMALKNATQDLSLCKKISEQKLKKECYACSTNAKDTNPCLEFRAQQLQDKSICDLIDIKSSQTACLFGISAHTNVEGCEQPQSLQEFRQCKQFELAQKEERQNAKKAATKMKTQKIVPAKTTKIQEKPLKIKQTQEAQAARQEEKFAKLKKAKDTQAAKAQEKTEKLQKAQNAKTAKVHAKAVKIKQAQDAQLQMKAEKLQKIQHVKAARLDKKKIVSAAEPAVAIPPAILSEQKDETILPASKDLEKTATAELTVQTSNESKDTEVEIPQTTDIEPEEKLAKEEKIPELPAVLPKATTKAQEKAAKLQADKAAKSAREQEKTAKLQKMKNAKAEKVRASAEKIQNAKNERIAKAREKVTQSEQLKKNRVQTKMAKVQPAKRLNSEIVEPVCIKGFGSWSDNPQKKNDEIACDKENIVAFVPLLNHCLTTDRNNIMIMSYDVNKDGCVTCDDLSQWKRKVQELYKAKKRSTNGPALFVAECKDRKF